MHKNIKFVLVNTTHPGNIGGVARAMKNMSLSELTLVRPKFFPHAEATARAAGADDLLSNAKVVDSLKEAISDSQLVIGTSVRERTIPLILLDAKAAAVKIVNEAKTGHKVSIVFGTENSGLSNSELQLCHYHLCIPTNSEFSSLNLAAAVLIVAYEIKAEALGNENFIFDNPALDLATNAEVELFYDHLKKVLQEINFLKQENPEQLMQRLRKIFSRIRLEKVELNILRGILTAIEKTHDKTNLS
jgi:tRNA (cytidine32/uridine32-2'-O)-methyltransferase